MCRKNVERTKHVTKFFLLVSTFKKKKEKRIWLAYINFENCFT